MEVDEYAEEIRAKMDVASALSDPSFKEIKDIIESYLKKHEKLMLEKYRIEIIVNTIMKSYEPKVKKLEKYSEGEENEGQD
jgi:hypothetical protein